MPTLKSTLQEAIKTAMRAKATTQLGTLRLLMAAIKQQEIDTRVDIDDNGILQLIGKMIKQRQESIRQYIQGNRLDLSAIEEAELTILKTYLPDSLTPEEITHAIEIAFTEVNPTSSQDMGKVMAVLKNKLTGRADLTEVSKQVKARLSA